MKYIIFILILISLGFQARSQDSASNWDINKIIFNLRQKTNSLNFESNGTKTKNFKNILDSNIFQLKSLLDDSYSIFLQVSNSDSLFRYSLLGDYKTLTNDSVNLQNVQDVTDDLNAKINSFSSGLDVNAPNKIQVEVTTFDSSLTPVSGYYVFWNFWFDKDNPKPFSKFLTFTNPKSSDFLTPAVYDIWVQKIGDSTRYPSIKDRTKSIIFLLDTEQKIPITIQVK